MAFCNMMVRPTSMYRRCPFELALSDACCSRNRPGCDYISYISCIRLIDQPTHYAFLGRRGGEPVMKVWEKPSQTRKTMSLSIKQNYIALGKPRPMKNQKQSPSSHHQLVQPLLLRSSLWSGVCDSSMMLALSIFCQTGLQLSFACCACTNRWVIAPYGSLSPCTHLEMYVHINI